MSLLLWFAGSTKSTNINNTRFELIPREVVFMSAFETIEFSNIKISLTIAFLVYGFIKVLLSMLLVFIVSFHKSGLSITSRV